jgi:hypothetical protein
MSADDNDKSLWLEIGDEVRNLATFAATGTFAREPRQDIRTVLATVQEIADAAQARLALQRDRPVKPRQLAALARTNTERLRQLPRTADGHIAPTAARDLLIASGVPSVASKRVDLTPTWWQSTLPGDRLRRAADALLRRTLPHGASVDEQLTSIAVVIPGGGSLNEQELATYLNDTRRALEKLRG